MPIINISVKNKIATAECGATIVCKNSDYIARFDFDEQWNEFIVKTAKFAYDDTFIPVVFMGTECAIPKLPNTFLCGIEVQAGDLRTASPAWVDCIPVLDDSYGEIAPPQPDVYDQIMQMLKDGVLTGAKIVETIYIGVDEKGGNVYKQIFDNGTENYFTAPKGLDAEVVIGEDIGTAYDGAKGAKNARDIQTILTEIIKIYEAIRKNAKNITENEQDFIDELAKKIDKASNIANGNLIKYNSQSQSIEDSGISTSEVKESFKKATEAIAKNSKNITKNALEISKNATDIKNLGAKIELDSATISQNKTDIRNINTDLSQLTERFNTLANSDDETLDQLKEIVNYIKNNKDLIDGITTTKVNVADIIDSLESTETQKPLSANQGAVLKGYLVDMRDAINSFLKEELPNRLAKTEEDIKKVDNKLNERTKIWYAMPMENKTLFSGTLSANTSREILEGVDMLPDVGEVVTIIIDGVKTMKVVGEIEYYDEPHKYVGNPSLIDSSLINTGESFGIVSRIKFLSSYAAFADGESHFVETIIDATVIEETWLENAQYSGYGGYSELKTISLPKEGDSVRIVRDSNEYEGKLVASTWEDTLPEPVLIPDFLPMLGSDEIIKLGFYMMYFVASHRLDILQADESQHTYSVYKIRKPSTLPREYLSAVWTAEEYSELPWVEDYRLTQIENTALFSFIPEENDIISVVHNGASYEGKLLKYDIEGDTYLVPDFLLDETSGSILDSLGFGILFITDGSTTAATFSDSSASEESPSYFSVYKINEPEKLPEKYLPIDTELDETSGRPLANSFFAKLFDFGKVQETSGSLLTLVDGVIKALPFSRNNSAYSAIVRDSEQRAQINTPEKGNEGRYQIANRLYVDNKVGGSTSISVSKNTSKVIKLSCSNHEGDKTDVPRGLYNGTGIYILYSNSAGTIEIIPENDATVTINGKFVILSVTPHSTTANGIRCCALYYNDLLDFGWKTAYTVLGNTITFKAPSNADLMVQYHQISPFRAKFPS